MIRSPSEEKRDDLAAAEKVTRVQIRAGDEETGDLLRFDGPEENARDRETEETDEM